MVTNRTVEKYNTTCIPLDKCGYHKTGLRSRATIGRCIQYMKNAMLDNDFMYSWCLINNSPIMGMEIMLVRIAKR